MSVSDILSDLGQGLKTAGRIAAPIAERTAQVVSGQAPKIDEEQRQNQTQLEDAAINAKAQHLDQQLQLGQKYGTLTPDQQQQYVDQITGLFSHPRHAGTLMEKLRQAIHPNGATASGPQAELPNPTPPGGTEAADQKSRMAGLLSTEDEKAEVARQQDMKDIDFWTQRMQAAGMPLDQINAARNEAIEHKLSSRNGQPKAPKGLKAMEQGGVFFGIENQDTGQQYMKSQLEPGGDAPPEAKQMYKAVQDASQKKDQASEKKQEEAEERQTRSFAHAAQMVGLQMQNQIELGNIREAQSTFKDAEKSYRTSAELSADMQKNADAARKGDQQAQIAILTDHAGGTTKLAGGRLTKPIMDELTGSLPFLEKVQKTWKVDDDGIQYLSGVTLSPAQVDRMLSVAQNRVAVMKDSLDQIKGDHPEAFPEPQGSRTGAKKVGQMLPKTGAGAASDPAVDKFLKSF